MAHLQLLVMLVQKNKKSKIKSITEHKNYNTQAMSTSTEITNEGTKEDSKTTNEIKVSTNLGHCHESTIKKLGKFRFSKPVHTPKEDLQVNQVHQNTIEKLRKFRYTGHKSETFSKTNGVSSKSKNIKIINLKPPKHTTKVKKINKTTRKITSKVRIPNQPTLSMVLEKTGPKLGKFWDIEIYNDDMRQRSKQFLVYDRSFSDARIENKVKGQEKTKTMRQKTGHQTD